MAMPPAAAEPPPVPRAPEPPPRRPEPEPAPEPEPVYFQPDPEFDPDPDPEPQPEPAPPPVPRPAPPRRADRTPPRAAPPLPRRRSRPSVPKRRDRPSAPKRPLPPAGPRSSRTGRRLIAALVLLAVAAVVFTGIKTFQPFHGDPSGLVKVTVPSGAGLGEIGDLLAEREVIDSPAFFGLNATLTGRRGSLRPGDYTLQRDMSYGSVLDALSRGPKAKVVKTFDVVIPEGYSIEENAGRVKQGGVSGDYVAAATAPAALKRAQKLGMPAGTETTEGFMFPATYPLVVGADAEQLVDAQLDAFRENFGSLDLRAAKRKNLTPYEVLIIASMIEREVQLDRERPLVASVIYNRLSDGMPLGIDATIRYASDNWDSPLLQSQLDEDTPYNTRLNSGLPPTPIGNPGLASMEAAASPAESDYLFYVVKPGTCGEHAFSSTDAEFQEDVARYNTAREAAGGKSPTDC